MISKIQDMTWNLRYKIWYMWYEIYYNWDMRFDMRLTTRNEIWDIDIIDLKRRWDLITWVEECGETKSKMSPDTFPSQYIQLVIWILSTMFLVL